MLKSADWKNIFESVIMQKPDITIIEQKRFFVISFYFKDDANFCCLSEFLNTEIIVVIVIAG